MYDYLVVGAGLYGAVFAHEAKKHGKSVLVIDKRPNIAGNVYTEDIEKIQKVHPVRIRNVSWSLVESPVTLIRIIAAATNSSPT